MTMVKITIDADMRIAGMAVREHERIAHVVEQELRAIDAWHSTVGRVEVAEVTGIYVKVTGQGGGRFGRGDGWLPAEHDQEEA